MYPIVEVPTDAPDGIEAVGSKRKFWYTRTDTEEREDWAESRISDVSIEFALRQVDINRNALLNLQF
mgnify:CR=1 FL=1